MIGHMAAMQQYLEDSDRYIGVSRSYAQFSCEMAIAQVVVLTFLVVAAFLLYRGRG